MRGGAPAVLEQPQMAGGDGSRPVLVTGAAGLVGAAVCRELTSRAWSVRALVRDPLKAAAALADLAVEVRKGDIRDDRALAAAMQGAGTVVHLAAIAIERRGQSYEDVNTGGTRALLAAAHACGARRFVFMSQNGASPESASRFLRSKGLAEQMVRESGLEWTAFRPSVIFGPDDEFVNVLARLVRLSPGVLPLPDGGRARFQPIAVRDVARAVGTALVRSDTIGGSYALGGPAALSLREMTERVLLAMRARRMIVNIPRQLLAPVVAVLQRVLPNPPVTTSLLELLGQDNVVSDNALAYLGVEPTPFAPEELEYLRRVTVRTALREMLT
ncbi:MAG TPA: NAD-dependent epimerase/dehydratase family protein [Gemmatimonadaceae bacterium]|nr:NAD-dependent epimerase/dehydratase family protein [Gemmatimonadaceae bacterium]